MLAEIGLGTIVFLSIPGMILFFFLLGRFTAGTGAELLDWDPQGHAADRMALDAEDTRQMLELMNRERGGAGSEVWARSRRSETDVENRRRGRHR